MHTDSTDTTMNDPRKVERMYNKAVKHPNVSRFLNGKCYDIAVRYMVNHLDYDYSIANEIIHRWCREAVA